MQNLHSVPIRRLEILKCIECSFYLSVPPVMYDHHQNFVCGRCAEGLTDSKGWLRATAFEAVASLFVFPCRYMLKGCPKKRNWRNVKRHEASCGHRPVPCPLGSEFQCPWQGKSREVLVHINRQHTRSILESKIFRFSLLKQTRIFKVIKDYPRRGDVFFLQIKIQNADVFFGLTYVTKAPETAAHHAYELKLKKRASREFEGFRAAVESNYDWTFNEDHMVSWNLADIKYFLKASHVICEIKIFEARNTPTTQCIAPEPSTSSSDTATLISTDLFNAPKCLICRKDMPYTFFFKCAKKHAFCESCKVKVANCPTCRLETIANDLGSHVNGIENICCG